MSANKVTTIVSVVLVSSVLLSGCSLFGSETKQKIDPPKSVTYTSDNGKVTGKSSGKTENTQGSIKTELYLIDKNGFVVPETLSLPKSSSPAAQALEYLVDNGPVSEILPNGFRAVLPADTHATVDIKNGVATVDFSKEFKNYQPADEMKILQSITWTLTQFDTVQKVKLKMAGRELTAMPVKGTPISANLTRSIGINLDTTDVTDLMNTTPLTVYYIGGQENAYYYVPVTKRINNNSGEDSITAAVDELVKGPNPNSELVSEFLPNVKLLEAPKVEHGKAILNFNESVFGSFDKKIISQHVLDALVLSVTEQKGIDSVEVLVDGKAELVNESGKKLTAPVTRPQKVNTGSF